MAGSARERGRPAGILVCFFAPKVQPHNSLGQHPFFAPKVQPQRSLRQHPFSAPKVQPHHSLGQRPRYGLVWFER